MSTDPWPPGTGRLILETCSSTMEEAAKRAPDLPGPTWILARRQTDGRGRRGRAWEMPEGNFAATLVMRPGGEPSEAALRSFVAALALYEACAAALQASDTGSAPASGNDRLSLKWPNDVLLDGRKLAGILLESFGAPMTLAVGIGVNLSVAPPQDVLEPGALPPIALGAGTDPEAFLAHLAPAFHRYETQLRTYGFGPIRAAWLDRAARLGERITARTPRETLTGRFETVDETGALVLETAEGRRVLPAAEVHF